MSNILAKVEGELPTAVKPELLVDAAEKALAAGCRTASRTGPAVRRR